LATSKIPLSFPPPRKSRFGGPLHWVRPKLVAEITYLGWTDEPLLGHTVFVGLREDKPAGRLAGSGGRTVRPSFFLSVNRIAISSRMTLSASIGDCCEIEVRI
jgi:hypothetical protein